MACSADLRYAWLIMMNSCSVVLQLLLLLTSSPAMSSVDGDSAEPSACSQIPIWSVSQPSCLLQAPAAEALACGADGRLMAVSSSEDILAMAGPLTQLVDLQGSFVTPVCHSTAERAPVMSQCVTSRLRFCSCSKVYTSVSILQCVLIA